MGSTLSSTPTAAGTFSFTLTVTESKGNTGNQMFTLTVDTVGTITGVTSSSNPRTLGQSVTITAIVMGSGSVAPPGTVTFAILGRQILGTGTLNRSGTLSGTATTSIVTSALPTGSYFIFAGFSGDTNFISSVGNSTRTVIAPVTFSVTAPTGMNSNNQGRAMAPVIRAGATLSLIANPNTSGISYTTSNSSVAVVNASTGVVTGIRAGTATISASGPNGAATITVTVMGQRARHSPTRNRAATRKPR